MLIGNNHIQVQLEEVTITTRIIKDPYPDYEGVIPKDNTKTLIVNKDSFIQGHSTTNTINKIQAR